MNHYTYRTYAEIDLDKMQHNLGQVRSFVGETCKVLFVLKADAYGHGTAMCAKYSEELVDWYGVATIDEAISIRNSGVKKPILILGCLQDCDLPVAAVHNLTINSCSLSYAQHVNDILGEIGEKIDCHIKIDTGMNRTGLVARKDRYDQAVAEAKEIFALPNLSVTGIYTHFSCGDSEDPEDIVFTQNQYDVFCDVVDRMQEDGYDVGLRHCTSTCPLLVHPEWKMDMVRVGMLGFGQSMTEEWAQKMNLHPIMRWCAKVVSILDLQAGESVSYGRIYRTEKPEKIAVLSVGYADGYNRSYSNRAKIILGGQIVPECGKICMDFAMADITSCDGVKVGDDAVILGEEGGLLISSDQLSACTEYGVNGWTTCQISARVPRIYLYHGEIVEKRVLFY